MWIGAWWLGCVIVGGFLLCISPFMMLFPSIIPVPGSTQRDAEYIQKQLEEDKAPSTASEWWKETINIAKRLCRNRLYVFHLLASNFVILGIVGFATFLPKYFEFVFRIRASNSVLGPASQSVAGVIGLLLAGVVVQKWRPRARK